MRFVPLLPSSLSPLPWQRFQAVELAWTGELHPLWNPQNPPIHALHLPPAPWNGDLGREVLGLLALGLDLDFLVLSAACPRERMERAEFLGTLEALLEALRGGGSKLALRPLPGEAGPLSRLLKEVRGEAVGFCWDTQLAEDPETVSDRLFCAVGQPGGDFTPLQRLGYRWNLALPAGDPDAFQALLPALERAHPPVLFPADLAAAPIPQERP